MWGMTSDVRRLVVRRAQGGARASFERPRSKRKLATFVFSVASGIRKGEEVGSVR